MLGPAARLQPRCGVAAEPRVAGSRHWRGAWRPAGTAGVCRGGRGGGRRGRARDSRRRRAGGHRRGAVSSAAAAAAAGQILLSRGSGDRSHFRGPGSAHPRSRQSRRQRGHSGAPLSLPRWPPPPCGPSVAIASCHLPRPRASCVTGSRVCTSPPGRPPGEHWPPGSFAIRAWGSCKCLPQPAPSERGPRQGLLF